MKQAAGSEIYIGLMSGTSLDGIDVAIVDFSGFPPQLIHCNTTAYSESLRQRLRELAQAPKITLDQLYSLDAELGETYADAVNLSLQQAEAKATDIAAVGCHGQTLIHSPNDDIPYTVQIGDPYRLASGCGITTVADFRRKDIALGGQAAPLAPAFHRFLFHSSDEDRCLINIGGIANITYLPRANQSVLGFDTGPGNTLLDYWAARHLGKTYDDRGLWGASGKINRDLLQSMISEEHYFRLEPPKSTATEYFDPNWLESRLSEDLDPADVQATLTELTAQTIADAVASLPEQPQNCYVCGGGARNEYLLQRLQKALPDCGIDTTGALGLDPDFVEAAAFAWLARQRILLQPGNIPEVTKAERAAILGGVYEPG